MWLYYGGLKSYANVRIGKNNQGATCLAVLRRDEFISLDGGEQGGTLLTRPSAVPADKLKVNLDAPRGKLGIDLLDESGLVLVKATPISGDLPGTVVSWDKGDLSAVQGKTVQLRFNLTNGSFYSYWFED